MPEKEMPRTNHVRGNAIFYVLGISALFFAVALTAADIVRLYFAYGTEYAFGMMIPRMGVLLGLGGSSVNAIICTAVGYAWLAAVAVFAAVAVRKFFGCIVVLVLFSADTLVAVWLFLSTFPVGFLPAFLLHAAIEILLIFMAAAGRKYSRAEHGSMRGVFCTAFYGRKTRG